MLSCFVASCWFVDQTYHVMLWGHPGHFLLNAFLSLLTRIISLYLYGDVPIQALSSHRAMRREQTFHITTANNNEVEHGKNA